MPVHICLREIVISFCNFSL